MSLHANSDKQTIASLKKENRALKIRLAKSKAYSQKTRGFNWKVFGVVSAIGFAGAMLIVGNLVFWTGRTITDPQRYVSATQPLIENQAIQQALAKKATTAIFENINVEQIAEQALPEQAQFLAPSIAKQVESFTNTQANNIVASEQFKNVWQTVNVRAHARLLNAVKNYQGDGTFDINDLYGKLSERLRDSKLSFLANRTLPANVGAITLISTPNLPKAHWVVVNLWWIRLLSITLFVLLTVLAVWLSVNRRKTIVRIGWLYAFLMAASLLALRITKSIMVAKIAPDYQLAGEAVWDIVLKSLIQQTVALLFVFVVVAVVGWLIGSSKSAVIIRSKINLILNGKLHQAIFNNKENAFTIFMRQHKTILEVGLLIIGAISLLIIQLTPINILIIVALVVAFVVAIEVLSAPISKK